MTIEISKDANDDAEFLQIVTKLLTAVRFQDRPKSIRVIRVAKWFDHYWLGFSGRGRVRFDSAFLDRDTALDSFWNEQLTFPPFTPKRILSEEFWLGSKNGIYEKCKPRHFIYSRKLQHSSRNLHRRVALESSSSIFLWFSSLTAENDVGAIMVYRINKKQTDCWYVTFKKKDSWVLHKTKGISRDVVDEMINQKPPNNSLQRTRPRIPRSARNPAARH